MLEVQLIRKYYPHWSAHSGINQYLRYLDPQQIKVHEELVPLGNDKFLSGQWFIPTLKQRLKHRLKHNWVVENGVPYYLMNDMGAEWRSLRLWLSSGYDVLHYLDGEHSFRYLPQMMQRFSWLRKRPKFVGTFHQPPDILSQRLLPEILPLLSAIVIVGVNQRKWFEQYVPAEKIHLIPHGIDTDYFCPSAQPKKRSHKLKCLSVGKWLRDYDAVLKVAESLEGNPDIEFHIVTKNLPMSKPLSNVVLHEGISDEALLELYQQSDVLFLPLQNATANNVLLEAISCGLAVISSDIEPVRYYLPGDEAILVKDNDPRLLRAALEKLQQDVELRQRMDKQARTRALSYAWDQIAQEYANIYQKP